MPWPGVAASTSSCRISPKSSGPLVEVGGNDACLFNAAVDLAGFELASGGLGRLMRLAKDWAFDEIWSSGIYLER